MAERSGEGGSGSGGSTPVDRILMGVIGRAHGVRGLVRVTSHTADPSDLTAYGPLADAAGRKFHLQWRGEGVVEVTVLDGNSMVKIADRDAAERLTSTRLYVERAALPPTEDDEYYLADLIGLRAVDASGSVVGTVAVVHDYGAGVSLEIVRTDLPVLLMPFTRASVPVVDLGAGHVVIVPPEETTVPVGETAAA